MISKRPWLLWLHELEIGHIYKDNLYGYNFYSIKLSLISKNYFQLKYLVDDKIIITRFWSTCNYELLV